MTLNQSGVSREEKGTGYLFGRHGDEERDEEREQAALLSGAMVGEKKRGQASLRSRRDCSMESYQGHWVKKRIYKTREIATAEIAEYIETFYNHTRRHSHLSGVSPEAFETASKLA